MSNVRVALRVRPLSKRETEDGGRIIVEVDGKVARIRSLKVDNRSHGFGDSREKVVTFGFDYCYWSVNPEDPQYASQDVVFQDLGTEVLSGAVKGYNICLFAYGQTGSGKTYTMLGTPASVGLTPRICEGLFIREEDHPSLPSSCRIKVSFLEIYNERVRDLLKQSDQKKSYTLRVREHPEMGPYVQGLSQHVVTNYKQVIQLLEAGIANRLTAATHVHAASSRSHAILTVHYTQAVLENDLPSEIASKINLVDLAGSERADPSYCRDRITEGANINKSLVTLGIVISTLAQDSQVFSSCQSLNSAVSDGGDSGVPSSPGASSGGGPFRRQSYIPYRDSVLTWLLKDSLGGNSKTIMVATVSPAHTSYSETMSTLRYASNARNIVNKPRVNEDANVKLIRELREEIRRLKAMLLSFELRNCSSLNDEKDANLKELVLQNELKIDKLTKDWTQQWGDWKALLELYSVDINRRRAGLVIDSSLPHLMALEDDMLSTGVVLYHLKEGTTKIGRVDSDQEQDIVLQGQWIERDHCTITSTCGVVVLHPAQGARCTVNGREVTASCRLTQGAVITLGKAQMFRFNHPAEAAVLRRWRQVGEAAGGTGSLEWLDLDGDVTASRLGLCPLLWKDRRVLGKQCEDYPQPKDGEMPHRARMQQQQCFVEGLRQQILEGQIRAEQELKLDEECINQQIEDNQQWLFGEETWLASLQQERHPCAAEAETDPEAQTGPSPRVRSLKRVVQLRSAEGSVCQKKATFQLERIIKTQQLLEARKSLEQLKTLCWLQDGCTQAPPDLGPSQDAVVPGPRHRSRSTSFSALSLRRLFSQSLPQPHSVLLNWDPTTTAPPMPDPAWHMLEQTASEENMPQAALCPPRTRRLNQNDLCSSGQGRPCTAREAWAMKGASALGICLTVSQGLDRVGKQPRRKPSQDSASLSQPVNKLKSRDEPLGLPPTSQSRRAKALAGSGCVQTQGRKEVDPVTHKAAKGASCGSSHPRGPQQTSGRGKAGRIFRAESKPTSASRASKRQQRVLAARVRDTARKFPHLPHSLKRHHRAGDPDSTAPPTDSSPVVSNAGENDDELSDTNSNYSVDSLSCVGAQAPAELLKPEDPQWEKLGLPEPEKSESDESQLSEDSLTGQGYQTQEDSLNGQHRATGHGYRRTRTRASGRSFIGPPQCGPLALVHKSFSLDSLADAEEELGEDRQERPFLGSPEEMPTESFWRLQSPGMSVVDQETASSSFYLKPPFQPPCGQSEPAVEACHPEKASSLLGLLPSRGSPLMSIDSWFSCDSKINPSSPPRAVGSLCVSPEVQEHQPCRWEKSGYRLSVKELDPSDVDAVLPCSFTLLPCDARNECIAPTSEPPLWRTGGHLQSGADGATSQGRSLPDTAQQATSEASNSSSVSNMLAASAASLTHVGSACERDWAALQQKYLLELSYPVLDAAEEPRPAFPRLEEDSASLAQPVGPGLLSNNFSTHLAKRTRLRAEKEQDRLSARLEVASDFFRPREEEVRYNKTSSAEFESPASGAHICAAENQVPDLMIESCRVRASSLGTSSQGSRKPGLTASSDESFFLGDPCHSDGTTANKGHWPHGWVPLGKNIAGQPGLPRSKGHCPLQEEKADCQAIAKDPTFSFSCSSSFPSDPELNLHSAPWDPFLSSLQPPPLETFYEARSRDALTETALEIPAYRKAGVPYPPPREAWGAGQEPRALHEACLGNDVPGPSPNQSPEFASPQPATSERPADGRAREAPGEVGECLGNGGKGSHGSGSFSGPPNRPPFSPAATEACGFDHQVGILNKKDNLLALMGGEKAPTQSGLSVSSSSSVPGQPLCVCDAGQGQDGVLRPNQPPELDRQCPPGARPAFICEADNLGLEKNMLGETTLSLKSRSVGHSASSPGIVVGQEQDPTPKWEGKSNTGLPGKALPPADSLDELTLPGPESSHERLPGVPSSQERSLSECKRPGKSQERTPDEAAGLKQSKRVTNDEEMARLIRSVVQLEHSILEIGSKQNVPLHASHTRRARKEVAIQDLEKADQVLRPGSPGDHLSFKYQSPFTGQLADVIVRDCGVRERKGLSGCIGRDAQVQSPFETWECTEEIPFVREPLDLAALESSARDTWGYFGTCSAPGEPPKASIHIRRMRALTRERPLLPRPESSSENEDLFSPAASPRGQPYALVGLGEVETMEGFQKIQVAEHISNSKQAELETQGRVEEMATQMGGSWQEEQEMAPQRPPRPHLLCRSRSFSLEADSPRLSQTVAYYQELTSSLPPTPGWPRSSFYAPHSASIFSVDCVLDSTVFKTHDSPLVTGVGRLPQSGDPRSHSARDCSRGTASVAHTAGGGSAGSTVARGAHGPSGAPDSICLKEEDRASASATPRGQGWGLRSTMVDWSTSEGLALQTEAAAQKERASALKWIASQLDERVSGLLEQGDFRDREARQKAGNDDADLGFPTAAFSAPASLTELPSAEPRRQGPSVHASLCLALLEEVRQAKAQGKKFSDSVARRTIVPYGDTLPEPECPSRIPGRPPYKRVDQSESDRPRDEGGALGLGVEPLSDGSGHLLADKRKVLETTPLSVESFQLQPHSESHRSTQPPSQASSPAAPALGRSHCPGELRHLPGEAEQLRCHTSFSGVPEETKEATGTMSSPAPLGSDCLISSLAVQEDRRVEPEKMVPTLSSRSPSSCSEVIRCHITDGTLPGCQESCPEHLEPATQDTTCVGSSGHFSVSKQEGKPSQCVLCGGQSSARPSGPKQDHVQCPGASMGLGEGRASPQQGALRSGALRTVELEDAPQLCENWKQNAGPGLAEACRAGNQHLEPSLWPDQRPSPGSGGIGEETPSSCPQDALDCMLLGTTDSSRALSASWGQEESRALPPLQLCSPQHVTCHTCSPGSSTSPHSGDGCLEKRTSKAVRHATHLPCILPSRACGMNEGGPGHCRESGMCLPHTLKPKGMNVELRQATPISSLTQDCSFPLAADVRTSPLDHLTTDGSSWSAGDPERTFVEKKTIAEFEDAPPLGMCSEPLRKFQDSYTGSQNLQPSQTKPQTPIALERLNAQGLGERHIENELVMQPQHGYLENTISDLPERPQLSTEPRNGSGLNLQIKFVTRLRHFQSTQVDSPWEEEEQQRDQAPSDGASPAQGGHHPSSDDANLNGQIRDARLERETVSKPEKWSLDLKDSATMCLGQSGPRAPVQRLDQPCSGRDRLSSHHRSSLPVIAVFSGPKHSPKALPRPLFSVVDSSWSLQKLNLRMEPPSPAEEETQGPHRFWSPHPKGCCAGELAASSTLGGEACSQRALAHLESRAADHGPLKPPTLPYPTSSALSCMPTPDTKTCWMPGAREQAQKERPEWQLSEADTWRLHFDSSDINPYILPWHPEGPGQIGWKQSVFGSAVDVSCSQTPQGLTPSHVARCSSLGDGLEDQNSPFHSHLSTYANAQDLPSTRSSTENTRASNEASKVEGLGEPHTMTGSEEADRISQLKGPPDEAGPKSKFSLAAGRATGPLDEILLLYPSAADHAGGQAKTSEQGTQTPDSHGLHWSCTDISSATPDASTSVSHLASWASMHSLSLHLSQLLHNTSELLGSLSQPSAARKEQHTEKGSPGGSPRVLRMDSCTQTPVDKGSQTDLSSPPLRLQAPETDPQEVSGTLEELALGALTVSPVGGESPPASEKGEAEEATWEMAECPDLQQENIHCRPQRSLVPLPHWKFQKDALQQKLPSVSPQGSASVTLPLASQPEVSSCLVVSSPCLSSSPSPGLSPNTAESIGEPRIQKKPGLMRTLVVDRASSPILTLSASSQGVCLPPGRLTHPAFLDEPRQGPGKLETSLEPPLDTPAPPGHCSQPSDELGGPQRAEVLQEERSRPLERNNRSALDLSLLGSPQPCPELPVSVLAQPAEEILPRAAQTVPTPVPRSTLASPPLRSEGWRLAKNSVHEDLASPPECGPLSSRRPRQWPGSPETEAASSPLLVEPALWGDGKHCSPGLEAELTDSMRLRESASDPVGACQPDGPPSLGPQVCGAPAPSHLSLQELPAHNKFRDWCGLLDGAPGGRAATQEPGTTAAVDSGEQGERPPQPPGWPHREQIPLQVGAQSRLSVELTEAKLHRGFGEADALLRALHSRTGEALSADCPACIACSGWEAVSGRQKKAIQSLCQERTPSLQHFRRTRSLSPQKQRSLLPHVDFPTRHLDLPSRRREYLQQLRKEVVETTRKSEALPRSAEPPSDIELLLRDYQRAREEAQVEIARARARLREQTEQEKLRIQQQIVSKLLREEEKLHTLASYSPLCTSSNGSLSSGITSGYNSNPALSCQLQSPDSLGDTNLSDSREPWLGDGRGRCAERNSRLCLAGPSWKSSAYGPRASLGSCCCSPSSLSSLGTCFSSSYQDLAKHIVDTSMTDVMAACSDNLHNLFIRQAAAGWNYQGEEQGVQLYYKVFSSTRHGFLGAGMVGQPLPQVWTAVSDPTLWPLYHKPIQSARLHQRVTNSVSLVYLVCGTGLYAWKQPRDFCCVCVEASEGPLSIMAVQSVYDRSMPRPSREVVRGEILPSAWILQPLTLGGKEVTRVVYLAQVELGAPGFPAQLLNSCSKQQPLVIARLASFLGS
ncbi:stAR-related lipid transfer protein 9 [Echinops telfairi]|uniref:StAR-related lipid transfer protein 9 n=1 Tax=Echinops telfairi TaxID=9371 RepID=A0AC55CSB3_ECHTE|nr:stAR-related lipid transfer protein 9 [Echinops telfairi]